jgi:hypothetical protein
MWFENPSPKNWKRTCRSSSLFWGWWVFSGLEIDFRIQLTLSPAPEGKIPFRDVLYDRMTENFGTQVPNLDQMFAVGKPFPLEVIELSEGSPLDVLKSYNKKRGLALDLPEMEYLVEAYKKVGRVRNLTFFVSRL